MARLSARYGHLVRSRLAGVSQISRQQTFYIRVHRQPKAMQCKEDSASPLRSCAESARLFLLSFNPWLPHISQSLGLGQLCTAFFHEPYEITRIRKIVSKCKANVIT